VIDPEHPQQKLSLPLLQTAPGRYEGSFAPNRYGSLLLRAVHKRDGHEVAESTGTISVPYPREYLALPPDESLLQRVAALTGGRLRPTPAQVWNPGDDSLLYPRERWPILAWCALVLLLCDVASRRLRLFGR
jgi:hypothetical protein